MHWSSKIPTRYKRSAITGELHTAKRIANNFNCEVKRKVKKFLSTGFPRNFIRNTIEYFNKDKDYYVIPEWLFDEWKLIILRLLFSESDEKFAKSLIKKLVIYIHNNRKFKIVWNTRNCDGVMLESNLNHKFQWPQKGLNCEFLVYEVVT